MIGALLLMCILFGLTLPLLNIMQGNHTRFEVGLMSKLFWYHMLFALIYYLYVQSSASDSVAYYERAKVAYEDWNAAYGTGTPFIDFIAYPFIHFMGFTYEMMMVLCAFFGYLGFVFFYIVFQENIHHNHYLKGFNLVTIILFLPNMHYWTASLGKGSIIFLGLAMVTYGLSKMKSRIPLLALGFLIVYHVRPHVFFLMAVAIVTGMLTGRQKVPMYQKLFVLAGSAVAIYFLYDDVLSFASIDKDNLFESFDQLSGHRASELAKSGSGIDISNYPLIFKLFTFWFRPLFVDAPGPIGIIVSFENLFCLYLTAKLFTKNFPVFLAKSPALVKISGVVFLGISIALSGTLSNLGIIIRQKSMVMYFLLFIILSYLDYVQPARTRAKKVVAPPVKRKLAAERAI